MIISTIILLLIGWYINHNFTFITDDFWFASGLLLLVLLSLIDQPHFSKDSNIFVNAVTASLSLLLVQKNERDMIFYCFLVAVTYLVISSYTLMWLRNNKLNEEKRIIQFFSRFNREIGKPEVVFSAFFLWGGIKQFTINSGNFNALLWFWIVFMILNIPSLSNMIEKFFERKSKDDNAVAKIFSIQSKNTFLAKLIEKNLIDVKTFDFVKFKSSVENRISNGIILESYFLNEEKWVKILLLKDKYYKDEEVDKNLDLDIVYKIEEIKETSFFKTFVGIVTENSSINRIRFIYNSKIDIKLGELVEVIVNGHKVLYQIVQGTTKVEQLEKKNESSNIIVEAIQLGEWNKNEKRFDQFGWVPNVNDIVLIASKIDEPVVEPNEFQIGVIPDTNYPVIINKEVAITHHLAILGVTGTGKSVFTRNLIKNITDNSTKIIIVDLTGEYKTRFENISNIISDDDAKKSFASIEIIATEKSKFANQQSKTDIKGAESTIKKAFAHSIKDFLENDKTISIFEIPDISNNFDILEYTRWFFWVLFKIAKTYKNYGKKVCVVLEEAHTIVPETSSMGVSDNASKATVNSIAQIALQGRKYDIGFIVIAQRTANVSKTVLTQCNSIISFQELDKTSSDFLSNYIGTEFLNILPNLKFRTAIAMGKAFKSTTPMIFEIPNIEEEIFNIPSLVEEDIDDQKEE
jgi:hypothetical protein